MKRSPFFSFFEGKVFGERAGLRVAVGALTYEYASCQWDQSCTQRDFSVGYGGFPFPSMSVGDDVLRRPVESVAIFGGDGHGILFLFILKEKFLGREFERGTFLRKAPLSIKLVLTYPKYPCLYSSSAPRTAPPAAPRRVLWERQTNL